MTTPTKDHSIIAIYESHTQAEAAIKLLHQAGLDLRKLSIVGKDFTTEEQAAGFYNAGDRMKFWGTRGAFWGSMWGLLFGTGLFFIPAIGPVVAMGPLVGWIVGALEGAAVGGAVGVLGAALSSIGIPRDSVVKYELEVKAGKFLVLARGSADEIERARGALKTTGASQLAAHVA
ncbi:MAG TPA: hypothetical protein VNZ26_33515 [Vicinamibacterales bacterium]|nr:hypothetical protein [Vicinamibacterales bacterium]